MKKLVILFLIILSSSSFAQNYFGAPVTVAASNIYDYKNPVFDAMFADLTPYSWLSYERYNLAGASDIVVRKAAFSGYDPEIALTSTVTDSNVNPSVYKNLIVWQSNKDGNKNIYYSTTNGTTWSAPLLLPGSTAENETQPYISNNNVSGASSNYYLLAFKRGPDIILKKYSTALNAWDAAEYNLSDSISEDCSFPVITGRADLFAAAFIKHVSDTLNKIVIRRFNLISSTGVLTPGNYSELPQNVIPEKINLSRGLIFDYPEFTFTKGNPAIPSGREVYIVNSIENPTTTLISSIPTGSSSSGKGVEMGIIFNSGNNSSTGLYCTAFGSITRSSVTNDSATISLCWGFSSSGSSNNFSHFTVGDMNSTTKMDMCSPLSSSNLYRIRGVFEKKINGRSALVESYATGASTSVNYLGTAVNYSSQQNYPNPFNPTTKIQYEIPVSSFVELKVYSSLGKEVSSLVNQNQTSGSYSVNLNASELPSGVYFYTLRAGDFVQTRKMILVK